MLVRSVKFNPRTYLVEEKGRHIGTITALLGKGTGLSHDLELLGVSFEVFWEGRSVPLTIRSHRKNGKLKLEGKGFSITQKGKEWIHEGNILPSYIVEGDKIGPWHVNKLNSFCLSGRPASLETEHEEHEIKGKCALNFAVAVAIISFCNSLPPSKLPGYSPEMLNKARKETWGVPDCLGAKCDMRRLVSVLNRDQARGMKGKVGPCVFDGLNFFRKNGSFFKRSDADIEAESKSVFNDYDVYYTIGDVHGDMLVFLSALRKAGVIDGQANWTKSDKKRCFIQLGDLLDRGGRSVSVDTSLNPKEEFNIMELAYHLNKQASASGDRLICLSGNHELFSIFSAFSSNFRKSWRDYTSKATKFPFMKSVSMYDEIQLCKGVIDYFAFVRPPIMACSQGWIFAHGNISAKEIKRLCEGSEGNGKKVVATINQAWAHHLRAVARRQETPMDDTPEAIIDIVQSRALAHGECGDTIRATERLFGFDWKDGKGGIVLGHTVVKDVKTKCGRVKLVDVGMSEAFRKFNSDHKITVAKIERGLFSIV
jgi:hypothetical protein